MSVDKAEDIFERFPRFCFAFLCVYKKREQSSWFQVSESRRRSSLRTQELRNFWNRNSAGFRLGRLESCMAFVISHLDDKIQVGTGDDDEAL